MEIIKNTIKKVTIGVHNNSNVDIMVSNALINQNNLYWCKGTLLTFEPLLPIDWIVQELAKGNVYYFSLTTTKQLEYKHEIVEPRSGMKISVVNLNNNQFWVELLEQLDV